MNRSVITSKNSVRIVGRFAFASAVLTSLLIIYGSWVRASGSGLGCPDWPLCKGVIVPGLEGDTLIEFGHRAFAGFVMLMVFLTTFLSWRRRSVDNALFQLLTLACALILVQAALGGITVLTELHGLVRLAHLSLALGILGLLTWSTIKALGISGSPSPSFGYSSLLLLVGIIVVFAGGSIVASSVSAGCPGIPFCDERSTSYIALQHNLHRISGGILLFLLIISGYLMARAKKSGLPSTKLATMLNHAAAFLVLLQGYIGISFVDDNAMSESLRVLHLTIAMLTMWSLMSLWILSLRNR